MGKIITVDSIEQELKQYKESIILVGGCFDVIHPGHIEFLSAAKKLSGIVTVLLESDATVARLKGNDRPIHTQMERAYVLSHITAVDTVILLPPLHSDSEYEKIITTIHPSVIAITADDPLIHIKESHAKKIGVKVVPVIDRKNEHATSKIANQLKI